MELPTDVHSTISRIEMFETFDLSLVVLGGLLCWFGVQLASRVFSSLCFQTYRSLSKEEKSDWDCRTVSWAHAVYASIFAFPIVCRNIFEESTVSLFFGKHFAGLDVHSTLERRLYGEDNYALIVMALSSSYFIWDLFVSLSHFELYGFGFLIHAVCCIGVFANSLRPFCLYYGGVFLMYEATGPFVNAHYFFDKFKRKSTLLGQFNSAMILITFFFVRLCFGNWQSYHFWVDIVTEWSRLSDRQWVYGVNPAESWFFVLAPLYCLSNLILNGLNIIWFVKIVHAGLTGQGSDKQKKVD